MTKLKDIICISYTTWEGEYTKSTVQLLSILAQKHNVFFIEYPRTIKDIFYALFGKINAPILRMLGLKKRTIKIETKYNSFINHTIMPPMIPINFIKNKKFYKAFNSINTWIYNKQLKKICKSYELNSPIIISAYNPVNGLYAINKFKQALNVYYCYDGMDNDRNHWMTIELEKVYCSKVHGIISSSDFLQKQNLNRNKNSYLVQNGVDLNMFSKSKKTKPHKNRKIKKVGYIGSLDYRFDIELMDYVIGNLPEIQFEFTGSVLRNEIIDNLIKYKNVHFLPAVKPIEVPQILSTYDAGIIPYNDLEINKGIYPLKVNEFLVIGLPVIMTNFAPLKELREVVNVVDNKQDFLKKIREEIEKDNTLKINKRFDFAKNNSWENRAEKFDRILCNLLKKIDV